MQYIFTVLLKPCKSNFEEFSDFCWPYRGKDQEKNRENEPKNHQKMMSVLCFLTCGFRRTVCFEVHGLIT